MSATTALTNPHFFRPLIPGFEDKFFIPVSFFKYLRGLECHELTLRSPGGKLWPIKINGRQFSDGWKQFVQDHDLHIGDFLVFRHQGDLVFDFVVFDRSACEREYPVFIPVKEPEESEDPPFSPVKEEEPEIQQEDVSIYTSSGKKLERKKKAKSYSVLEHPYPNRVVKLSPDSIKKNRLHIPRNFARENGLYGRSCSIILKDEYSNCWRAKLIYTSSDKKLNIGAGWSVFHSVHKFEAGDSLMVELIKNGEKPVFRIRKLQEHAEFTWEPLNQNNAQADSSSPGHPHANTKAFELTKSNQKIHVPEVAKESESEKSKKYEKTEAISEARVKKCFFVAKITPATYKVSHLYIPTIFSRQHLRNKKYSRVILKDQEGRSWLAKLWHTFSNMKEQVRITDGWREFSSANKLKPGDSFVFEYIENGNRPVFKLYGCEAFSGRKQAAALPHFYVNMQISYYRNPQKIPRNFAKRHGLGECSAVTVKNDIGKTWLVSLRLDHNTNEVHMTCGWIEFVRENGIEGEDVFMLELVKGGTKPEMKYYGKFLP